MWVKVLKNYGCHAQLRFKSYDLRPFFKSVENAGRSSSGHIFPSRFNDTDKESNMFVYP